MGQWRRSKARHRRPEQRKSGRHRKIKSSVAALVVPAGLELVGRIRSGLSPVAASSTDWLVTQDEGTRVDDTCSSSATGLGAASARQRLDGRARRSMAMCVGMRHSEEGCGGSRERPGWCDVVAKGARWLRVHANSMHSGEAWSASVEAGRTVRLESASQGRPNGAAATKFERDLW